jgi:hypothetical protein
MMPSPYERIDALEVLTRQMALQIAQLAGALAQQSALMASLLSKLGESSETLPGEHAPQPDSSSATPRKGRH